MIAHSFTAMSHWKLWEESKDAKQQAQARTHLKQADELFRIRVEPGDGIYSPYPADDIQLELIIKEADALIDPDVTNAPYVGSFPEVGFPE